MRFPAFNLWTTLALCLWLSSCTTLSIDPALSVKSGTADSWLLRGKLGVQSEKGNGSMQIVWRQSGTAFDVHLMGPMGKVVAHVHGMPERFWMDIPGQAPRLADLHSREIEEALGWELPILEMIYWVRGQPSPGIPERIVRDQAGRVETLLQSGWLVDFKDYEEGSPVRTRFSKDATVITLIVKEWQMING